MLNHYHIAKIILCFISISSCNQLLAIGPEQRIIRLKAYYGYSSDFITRFTYLPGYRIGGGVEYRFPHTFLMLESDLSYINSKLEIHNNYRTSRISLDGLLNFEFGKEYFFFSPGIGLSVSGLLSQNFEDSDSKMTKSFTFGLVLKAEIGVKIYQKLGVNMKVLKSHAETTSSSMVSTKIPGYPSTEETGSTWINYIIVGIYYTL